MRFESVTAVAFGPFVNRILCFAEGLNVVYGLNEAGKSTWHAALYAGLCGLRRGRGTSAEDRLFRERHQPWDGGAWEVSTIVALADGRRVELRHDLDGRVACSATDADFGRDYSAEVMHDGAPDGSRWLDLDRRSFLATACVQQADLLAVPEHPELLQEHLQRAAATAGTDATAAQALANIADFFQKSVGLDRANSSRPLPRARRRVEAARQGLQDARSEHDCYLALVATADRLDDEATGVRRQLRVLEAAQAAAEAIAWSRRLERARELRGQLPTGPPPPLVDDDALAREAEAAVQSWQQRPESSDLPGPSAAELQAQLDKLPQEPHGDRAPHVSVDRARESLAVAERLLAQHRERPIPMPDPVQAGGLSEAELRDIAHELSAPQPGVDPALVERLERARTAARSRGPTVTPPAIAAAGLAVLGLLLAAAGAVVPGALLFLAGALGAAFLLPRPRGGRPSAGLAEVEMLQAAVAAQEFSAREAARRRNVATERARAAGLDADSEAVRRWADDLAALRSAQETRRCWGEQERGLVEGLTRAQADLGSALRGRGAEVEDDLAAAMSTYLTACAERDEQARAAQRREQLAAQLEDRKRLEATAADARLRRARAAEAVQAVAARLPVPGGATQEPSEAIRAWLQLRTARLHQQAELQERWTALQSALGEQTFEQLEAECQRRAGLASQLSLELDPAEIVAAQQVASFDERRSALSRQLRELEQAVAEARGATHARASQVPSVAEAEEEQAAAAAELARILDLERTLTSTREFLERAQERVHRDIAPRLAASVRRWLPSVTADRYVDVRIDPRDLKVRVAGQDARWRDAGLLSRGTAEQIYLLLRVALAQHLTRPGEACPLVLDDVTVQCDAERTTRILEALHAVSQDRQVIVFTQEREVAQWAAAHVRQPRDLLTTLDRPRAANAV
ncbi:MAG: AAA family ATPase [Chloroflexi bacterium]|nr:AAA family ATPase [Chloroflexota bacterium]